MKMILRIFLIFLLFFGVINVTFAQDDSVELKNNAVALYNANKLQDAYQLISQIPEEKRDAELWLMLANITQDYNNEIDSVFLLQRALSIDPTYYKAYYNLGNLYFQDDKPIKAIENYELTIKYNKKFAYAYYNLGCCYLKDGKYSKAKSYFLKAIKLKSTEPNFYYNLALTCKKMNDNKQAQIYLSSYDNLTKN